MATLDNIKVWDPEKKTEVSVVKGEKIPSDARLELNPVPFKAYGKTTRISNVELSKLITSAFKPLFNDLLGTLVSMPIAVGQFRVDLYFEYNRDECPDNAIRNLISLINPKDSSVPESYARTHALYSKRDGKVYDLNRETKILLAPLMFGGADVNRPENENRWKQFVSEVPYQGNSPYYNGRGMVMDRHIINVTGLDINKVIRAIYGTQMTTHTVYSNIGGKVEAENFNSDSAKYIARFAEWSQSQQGEFLLNIEQFDDAEVKAIFAKEHPMVYAQQGPICF